MLIIALVLALIGLVALVFAVVTSNELVAWVCVGACVLGVVLLIIDALRERQRAGTSDEDGEPEAAAEDAYEYPEELEDELERESGGDESPKDAGSEASEESAK